MLYRFLFFFLAAVIFSGSVVRAMHENPWENIEDWDEENINKFDYDDMTPLMRMIFRKDFQNFCRALKNPHIDLNAADKHGTTALMFAISQKNKKMVKALLECKNISINQPDNFGNTALVFAVKSRSLSIVEKLLKTGKCDCCAKTKTGKMAINFSIENSDKKITDLLLPHSTKNERSLLHSLSNLGSLRHGSLPNLFYNNNNNDNIDFDEGDDK